MSSRELNPYVAKGVDYADIPGKISFLHIPILLSKNMCIANTPQATPGRVVGDGGASWRARALRRAKESAAAEGRDLDVVVVVVVVFMGKGGAVFIGGVFMGIVFIGGAVFMSGVWCV